MKSLCFMVIGAQKAGTTALSHFLDQHPDVCMAKGKEVHVFDAPDYDAVWSPDEINERYQPHFAHARPGQLLGEATPIYLFWPEIAEQLYRYNPALKLIILLRDPVERAISHYAMEYARGAETRPLWQALLLEDYRLREPDHRDHSSASRCHSYRSRGYYARQLANLRRYFPDRQLLVLENSELAEQHEAALTRLYHFLQISAEHLPPPENLFAGEYKEHSWPFSRWLLRLAFAGANRELSLVLQAMGYHPAWPWLRHPLTGASGN